MSNDWREHNGGPQPVGDDDWLEVLFPGTASGWMARAGNRMALTWKGQRFKWRFINDHLIDAARLEGIRLGLEAAMKTVCNAEVKAAPETWGIDSPEWGRFAGLAEATDLIRNLNPETIAKEAQHD